MEKQQQLPYYLIYYINQEIEITAFLGGISNNYKTNFFLSEKNDILIVEADEYDRSFLQLYADIAIITSVDADHMDIYNDFDDLKSAFKICCTSKG